jgi:hypothetical protein
MKVLSSQSIHGRMGLWAVCRGETSRMKNVSIVSSGGRKNFFGLRKTVYPQKNSYILVHVFRLRKTVYPQTNSYIGI